MEITCDPKADALNITFKKRKDGQNCGDCSRDKFRFR